MRYRLTDQKKRGQVDREDIPRRSNKREKVANMLYINEPAHDIDSV